MLKLLTVNQEKRIINNIVKCVKTGSIEHLNKQGYSFLYLCSGFIAHYNLNGFKYVYQNTEKLKQNLINNRSMNQWDNFSPNDKDYHYYKQKQKIYNSILEKII